MLTHILTHCVRFSSQTSVAAARAFTCAHHVADCVRVRAFRPVLQTPPTNPPANHTVSVPFPPPTNPPANHTVSVPFRRRALPNHPLRPVSQLRPTNPPTNPAIPNPFRRPYRPNHPFRPVSQLRPTNPPTNAPVSVPFRRPHQPNRPHLRTTGGSRAYRAEHRPSDTTVPKFRRQPSVASSSGVSSRSPAWSESRIVAGRCAPGMTNTWSPFASSHASTTCW